MGSNLKDLRSLVTHLIDRVTQLRYDLNNKIPYENREFQHYENEFKSIIRELDKTIETIANEKWSYKTSKFYESLNSILLVIPTVITVGLIFYHFFNFTNTTKSMSTSVQVDSISILKEDIINLKKSRQDLKKTIDSFTNIPPLPPNPLPGEKDRLKTQIFDIVYQHGDKDTIIFLKKYNSGYFIFRNKTDLPLNFEIEAQIPELAADICFSCPTVAGLPQINLDRNENFILSISQLKKQNKNITVSTKFNNRSFKVTFSNQR